MHIIIPNFAAKDIMKYLWLLSVCLLLLSFIPFQLSVQRLTQLGKWILGLSVGFSILMLYYLLNGHSDERMIIWNEVGFVFDSVSILFYSMVSWIGWVVVNFSRNYLMGDKCHYIFIKRLLFTISIVQLLMIAGDLISFFLFWYLSDVGLRKLIALYEHRKYALITEQKKMYTSALSNVLLFIAFTLIYINTKHFGFIENFEQLNLNHQSIYTLLLSLVGISAIIKSANIPFYGWVLGVMEAPTPVSALLHAGLLNAGSFLVIRFSSVFSQYVVPSFILVFWGGLSALFGTLVSFYQPAVKTRLSYSSVGHMGFSIMLGGLGLYPAAMLHLIAHSFYKAYTFLSSGSEIDKYKNTQTKKIFDKKISWWNILLGLILSYILIFSLYSLLHQHQLKSNFNMLILLSIISVGLSVFLVNTSIYIKYWNGLVRIISFVIFVSLSFFILEYFATLFVKNGSINWLNYPVAVICLVIYLLLFIALALYSLLIKWKYIHPVPEWDVYIRNGFYLHWLFDKIMFLNTNNKKSL